MDATTNLNDSTVRARSLLANMAARGFINRIIPKSSPSATMPPIGRLRLIDRCSGLGEFGRCVVETRFGPCVVEAGAYGCQRTAMGRLTMVRSLGVNLRSMAPEGR
jgi:hypothetical protein